jgi:hypothetical protein
VDWRDLSERNLGAHDLSVVIQLPGSMWLARCECRAESTQRSQAAAFEWLVTHACLLDVADGSDVIQLP